MTKTKMRIDARKLPDFKKMKDEEIAEFWDTHSVAELWTQLEPVNEKFKDTRAKKAISFRIDEEAVDELRTLAESKGIGYQTLMRIWIKERLSTERKKTA